MQYAFIFLELIAILKPFLTIKASRLTFLLEALRVPGSGYVYLGMALKNHAPVLFHSCSERNKKFLKLNLHVVLLSLSGLDLCLSAHRK